MKTLYIAETSENNNKLFAEKRRSIANNIHKSVAPKAIQKFPYLRPITFGFLPIEHLKYVFMTNLSRQEQYHYRYSTSDDKAGYE